MAKIWINYVLFNLTPQLYKLVQILEGY